MKLKHILVAGAAMAAAFATVPANAAVVYMTGTSNPWGQTTNEGAMDAAFGAGNWTKFNGFDASVLNPANSFIFFDGSDGNGIEFSNFLAANLTTLQNFVTAGGRILSNIATNVGPNTLDLGFGYTSTYPNYTPSAQLTAAGIAAGLGNGGAGTSWGGNYFGHNINTGSGTCYVEGNIGGGATGCVFAGGAQGAGAYFVGGQTTTNFHTAGGFELRVNELLLASRFQGNGAVPEPATWMMMLLGFGLMGGAMRYRRRSMTVTFA